MTRHTEIRRGGRDAPAALLDALAAMENRFSPRDLQVATAVLDRSTDAVMTENVTMVQIRNVPEDLHRSLKERAAREGRTLSDLILRELPRIASRPSLDELLERIRNREPVGGPSAAGLIAAERADHHAGR